MSQFCVVLITSPRGPRAKKIAREIVAKRLAACVNIVPSVHSIYWWEGKIEAAGESLLIVKTKKTLVKKLIQQVLKVHPYRVPEVISLPILAGHKPYLDWVKNETN